MVCLELLQTSSLCEQYLQYLFLNIGKKDNLVFMHNIQMIRVVGCEI
jgi:hypothetical protein